MSCRNNFNSIDIDVSRFGLIRNPFDANNVKGLTTFEKKQLIDLSYDRRI